ncbi:MAG: hypothetical protein CMB51_03520 [Euryarchaeota archaeon]|nr:hypothetical protein [Euryarchaeota archaeon]|tara:strand:+ start:474 stop:716 length:243 start_codon:yes stop_codon:yes gene_type:complete
MGWEHKDRVYLHPRRYETAGKKGWGFAGIDIQLQENEMTFEEWLDYHCQEGWSLFKVSRELPENFTQPSQAWCIFRREVE